LNRASTGLHVTPGYLLLFLLTALLAAGLVSACDSSGAPPTETAPADSGQTAILQATPGLPRGKAVYARYCNTCHPGGGKGAGPSLIELAPGLSDDQIKSSVRKGRPRMSSFGDSLISNDALADLVAYIRTLR
jgi:mono/diheme cytochrome c family protein